MMNPTSEIDIDAELGESGGEGEWDNEEQRHGVAQIASILSKVDNVKDQVHGNIVLALENTAKLEDLEATSAEVVDQAAVFKKQTRSARRQMMMRNMKWTAIVLLVVGVIAASGFGIFHKG